MKEHLVRYEKAYCTIVACIQAVMLGLYLNHFGKEFENSNDLFRTLLEIKGWNILLGVVLLLLVFQIWINVASKHLLKSSKEQVINKILEAACNALIYPHMKRHIRAIVTICDYKKQTRRTIYSFNIEADPERTAEYDLYFGVTGETVRRMIPLASKLDEEHVKEHSVMLRNTVVENLKCVLAAPILDRAGKKVVAVIAFDSCETIETMKFDTNISKRIAQSWADILSVLI